MPVITTVAEMHQWVANERTLGHTIGCIPTMGYLHDGHASLIREASLRHGAVVISIFVNPTQFGPSEDFERYPRDLDRDLSVVAEAGGSVVFAPTVNEMYPNGAQSTIHVSGVTEMLEGALRPTHFDGVATVVSHLFEAMLPDEAFFGQKDLQQTLVIRRMVEESAIDTVHRVKITVMPTQREADGLARSSRNVYLSDEDRAVVPVIHRALSVAANSITNGERSRVLIELAMFATLQAVERFSIDYAVAVDASTLLPKDTFEIGDEIALCVAVRIGRTRLIDNELVRVTA
ncbi:MAG: pantoate--beta-alanine ligase [Ignavibacteria bacterium]|nr:pantoate--beta-alanine ligase [Ignavibacteria bacterium]MBK6418974.1 pantoate--beta-alanine ligase [Ignavibacteria bacterium]MBL0322828.1 pantoate--beta-alanine ligase [Ignavibacteria bacterium]